MTYLRPTFLNGVVRISRVVAVVRHTVVAYNGFQE